jgi:hypothetical protein
MRNIKTMDAYEFCYWLQGYFELSGGTDQPMSADQVKAVANHLDLVFVHDIDMKANKQSNLTAEQLQDIHDNGSPTKTSYPKKPIKRC